MADIKKKLVDGAGLQAAMGIMANYADKGVRGAIGGYNQSFPLTAATKGNIYYHKGTNRYYICVDNYNGSSLTNPNSKFEELSVYTNRQRLDNLFKKYKYYRDENYGIDVADFNTFKDIGIYNFETYMGDNILNKPCGNPGVLLVFTQTSGVQQLYLANSIYYRFCIASSWNSWVKLTR